MHLYFVKNYHPYVSGRLCVWGRGGSSLTAAIFKLCNEFILRGHEFFSFASNFTANIYQIEKTYG